MDASLDFADLFCALGGWARTTSRGVRAGGGSRGYDYIQLHTRPEPRDPEVQLTFRAQLVDGRPVIAVSRSPELPDAQRRELGGAAVVARLSVDDDGGGVRGRDPSAACEACGAMGTVGRAARTDGAGAVTEMHRFCADCWPEQSARYRARWEEEDRRRRDAFLRDRAPKVRGAGPGMWFESATWHGTLDLVRQIERAMVAPVPPAVGDLARLAAEIREQAGELEGKMPLEVEAFLQRYGAPAG